MYGGLINSIIRKHMYHLESYQDECMNDILLAIWDNIACYDPTKNSSKNWVSVVSKYTSLNYIKKYQKLSNNTELDYVQLISEDSNINGLIQQDTRDELEMLLGCLKNKDKIIFTELYLNDKNMKEIY